MVERKIFLEFIFDFKHLVKYFFEIFYFLDFLGIKSEISQWAPNDPLADEKLIGRFSFKINILSLMLIV